MPSPCSSLPCLSLHQMISVLKLLYLHVFCLFVCGGKAWYTMEVRGQVAGIIFIFCHVNPGHETLMSPGLSARTCTHWATEPAPKTFLNNLQLVSYWGVQKLFSVSWSRKPALTWIAASGSKAGSLCRWPRRAGAPEAEDIFWGVSYCKILKMLPQELLEEEVYSTRKLLRIVEVLFKNRHFWLLRQNIPRREVCRLRSPCLTLYFRLLFGRVDSVGVTTC